MAEQTHSIIAEAEAQDGDPRLTTVMEPLLTDVMMILAVLAVPELAGPLGVVR